MRDTLTVILAGGRGSRLEPLTRDRAKPAVPFGGIYRITDFVLSNCLNSDMRRLLLLTQYKGQSLDRHIHLAWSSYFCRELGEFIDVVPPQQRIDDNWYQGTADAVYQNIYAIEREQPEHVVILAGDHIYKMNYKPMVEYHRRVGADITVGALRVSREDAKQFGVMQMDPDHRIVGFQEKPENPIPSLEDPEICLASMGIYVFNARFLYEQLCDDATKHDSSHDFGKDIIPGAIDRYNVFAFPFLDENRKRDAYWRDVGTVDAYWQANIDLTEILPELDLYDRSWPIWTYAEIRPPAKFVHNEEGRRGMALSSLVSGDCIISGSELHRSLLFSGVLCRSYSKLNEAVVLPECVIGRHASLSKVVLDRGVKIPAGLVVGEDPELDASRFRRTASGICLITQDMLNKAGLFYE